MAQIRRENMPEKAQAFGFPKVIELSVHDKHSLKKSKVSQLGHLNNAHHGSINICRILRSSFFTEVLKFRSVYKKMIEDINKRFVP